MADTVELQGLVRELRALLPEGSARRAHAAAALGEALAAASRSEDAAVALLAAGQPEAALTQYCLAGEWRMALALAGVLCVKSGGLTVEKPDGLTADRI